MVTPGNRHFADIEAEDMCAVVDLGGGAAPPGQSALENETGVSQSKHYPTGIYFTSRTLVGCCDLLVAGFAAPPPPTSPLKVGCQSSLTLPFMLTTNCAHYFYFDDALRAFNRMSFTLPFTLRGTMLGQWCTPTRRTLRRWRA